MPLSPGLIRIPLGQSTAIECDQSPDDFHHCQHHQRPHKPLLAASALHIYHQISAGRSSLSTQLQLHYSPGEEDVPSEPCSPVGFESCRFSSSWDRPEPELPTDSATSQNVILRLDETIGMRSAELDMPFDVSRR